jgi:hypothetical protein
MFILAYRFRHGNTDHFPHDAYPVETAWTGPAKAPKLVRKWQNTKQGRLTCTWFEAVALGRPR